MASAPALSTAELEPLAGPRPTRPESAPHRRRDQGSDGDVSRDGARAPSERRPYGVRLEELGDLAPIGRPGGQGRVYRPVQAPAALGAAPLAVKIYRQAPAAATVQSLAEMVQWGSSLEADQRLSLHRVSAWPLAIITNAQAPVGIAMYDVSRRFEVPFVMPSGRRERVLLSLEHLLGSDGYLQLRGLGVRLDTAMRVQIAERISAALAFLHRHAIVASDIAPNNLLVAFGTDGPEVCFIDCDSMVFHGRQALPAVETADWQIPAEFSEPARTRATDAYKLGLVVLRLLARSHDARAPSSHARHVPAELRGLLARALGPEPANRPPAGEWQRALRELLAGGALSQRYPGPAPASHPAPARYPARAARRTADVHPPAARVPPAAPGARRSTAPRASPPRSRGSRHPVTLVWLAVVAVVFWLALARLFAAASPAPGGGTNFDPGSSGSAAGNVPQYYFQPTGPGSGR